MKGFTDEKGKFRPTEKSSGLKSSQILDDDKTKKPLNLKKYYAERSERMVEQFGVPNTPIDKENTGEPQYIHKVENIKSIKDAFTDARLRIDNEHVVAKIIGRIQVPDGYEKKNTLVPSGRTVKHWSVEKHKDIDTEVYRIGESGYLEYYLKKVAVDAYKNGLIQNAGIKPLLSNFQIYYDQKYKPLVLKKDLFTYYVASYDGNPAFEAMVKQGLGKMVKEHDCNLEHGIYPKKE